MQMNADINISNSRKPQIFAECISCYSNRKLFYHVYSRENENIKALDK